MTEPVNPPEISVCIVTYNQERYIRQCVESALAQDVTVSFEIVIGDDCSEDATRAILTDLQAQYPDKIRLLLHEKNLGNRGGNNFLKLLQSSRGRYLATLDGDDYWTDPGKLRKQYEALEAQPDFAVCFHGVRAIHAEDDREIYRLPGPPEPLLTVEDICRNNYIHTNACFFRNVLGEDLEAWLKELPFQDWALHIYLSRFGKVRYLDEVMSVWRVHPSGNWNGVSAEKQIADVVKVLTHCDEMMGLACHGAIQHHLASVYRQVFHQGLENGAHRDVQGLGAFLEVCDRLIEAAPHHPVTAVERETYEEIRNTCRRVHEIFKQQALEQPSVKIP
jgi:glycosyltransferase involved in cell wall biosynthesis